jgi:catechol 2,3-dioxygenase
MHPSMKIGYVSLNVSDIQRSVQFYQSVLGFKTTGRVSGEKALLSVDGSPSFLVELQQAEEKDAFKRAGLYHFAVLLPERKFLAGMLRHLGEKRDQVHFEGMADHLVSESIYIRDPDMNGIEIYRDRPSSEWNWDGKHVRMATERLDAEGLLREDVQWEGMPAGTTIGHMHLHVRDLGKAMEFYSEILSLDLTSVFPGAYFFAAGRYHHHIATNTWLGNDALAASPEQIGLNHFGIKLPGKEELEKTMGHISQKVRVKEGQGSVSVSDSDGMAIRIYY